MKRLNLKLGIVVASFTLAAAPAFAQKPESGGSPGGGAVDRSSGAGATSNSSGGGAVDRGSAGGGGGGSAVSSVSSSSSNNSNSNSPSASASSSPSVSFGDRGTREYAPQHRAGFSSGMAYSADDSGQKATPRASGPSGGSGGTAVTRGGGSSGGSTSAGGGTRAGSGDSGVSRAPARTRTAPSADVNAPVNNANGTREVPTWARPRGDRPVTGEAVDRTVPPPDHNGHYNDRYGYGYGGYYDPYGYYGYGSSPFYGNYYYPYGFGMGYGLYSGFGWAPYYGDPSGDPYGGYGGGGGGGYATSYGRGEQGNLKLKVKPRAAKVYVDGYFVGTVDQFDGAFQKLALNTGRHKVEVKADGFQTAEFDVLINPEQTVTFQGDLKRIQ